MKEVFNWKEYEKILRESVTEGLVLLRNENSTLPISQDTRVAIFGRIQLDYYSAGAGSGGMVNTPYEVSIVDGLRNAGISVNEDLYNRYVDFEKENPFDPGLGWAQEPYFQKEMPLSTEIVENAAKESDAAIVVIGRCAGEDKDAAYEKGSYLLTDDEENMLSLVCNSFKRVIVLLNVGGIMDMKWVDTYKPQAVMYVWQGGIQGGNGIADVLTGKSNPSGHLSDTIAYNIEDYPSTGNFGDVKENFYVEDIYVGYRYFETLAKDKVMYPFGFGLSYTNFDIEVSRFEASEDEVRLFVRVTNTGTVSGKEVVQVYFKPPMGALGKPARNLIRFAKTVLLQPGMSQRIPFTFKLQEMASYDDNGYTGNISSYVLEEGDYEIYIGNNVRDAKLAGSINLPELYVVERLSEALAPTKPFERLVVDAYGSHKEPILRRQINLSERIEKNRPQMWTYKGDMGYKLADVEYEKVSLEEFLSQLSDEDLICMCRGEGMCSNKVTPGIAGAFGGVTESLEKFGIPVAGCSDGPAGIRMDTGEMAFSTPSGTLLACSFNIELVNRLFVWVGKELRLNKIDTILGPGMNIHRHPLNGRNFEYFSEDPYLTGEMAISELKGMGVYGVTGTLKHFAANNQETMRYGADSVVSERALREIYLKGFERAVKLGGAYSIMSTYGPVNGTFTAGNYDLLTTILRDEWRYEGIVMTDWWANVGGDQEEGTKQNVAPMITAQNDVYMVVNNAATNSHGDNIEEALKRGEITRGELLRCAANICKVLLRSPVMYPYIGREDIEWEQVNRPEEKNGNVIRMERCLVKADEITELPLEGISTEAGSKVQYSLQVPDQGVYDMTFTMRSDLGELAQMNVTVSVNKIIKGAFTINGTGGKQVQHTVSLEIFGSVEHYIDIYFGQSGISIDSISMKRNPEKSL